MTQQALVPQHASVLSPHRTSLSLLCLASLVALPLGTSFAERARGSYVKMEQPPEAQDDHEDGDVPRILYLNRCKGGCVITPGPDNAIENTSGIANFTANIAEFPYGDEVWDEVVACVAHQYRRFNINITDEDPGTQLHFESIVAGDPSDIGAGGAAGIAPFSCGVWGNSINYTFAEVVGGNAQQLCEVIAQESGHVMGLEHALLCEDPMTYLDGCGAKEFRDIDAECGEFNARPCDCGRQTQNSVQHLLSIFGPGNLPPTANIEIRDVKEDPGNSDGNAIAEPGENLLIDISLSNEGSVTSGEVLIKIKSGGHLRLIQPAEPVFVEPGQSTELQLEAVVEPSACGQDVEFDVTTTLDEGKWSDSRSIRSGIGEIHWTSSIAQDEPWSPDDGDEAVQGGWEYGVPSRTIFAGRVLQSDGAGEGANSAAWMTGLGGEWDTSSVIGRTILETSSIALPGWHTITGIRYRLWHHALDRSAGGLDPAQEAHFRVELSKNGGKTWREIDAVVGESYRWDQREVLFDEPISAPAKAKLRFIVENDGTVEDLIVEAGIDEVTLLGGELLCEPPAGCGCSTGNSSAGWLMWLVPVWMFLRRRHRQAAA